MPTKQPPMYKLNRNPPTVRAPPLHKPFCGCDTGKYIDRSGADKKADKELHPEKYRKAPKKKTTKELFSK
jgi:hypothetical protein